MTRRGFSLLLLFASLFIMTGCAYGPFQNAPSEKVLRYEENFEITGNEKNDLIGKVNPALFETSDRSNALAEEVDIPVVPKDGKQVKLPSGRYTITGHPTGNVFIRDEDGGLVLREIVGNYAGVGSLTVDIDETYTVLVDGGYDSVNILPAPTFLSTELVTGIWEVGLDIEAGNYTITTPNDLGYLQIFDKNNDPKMYELIGGTVSSTKSEVRLLAGQKLRITGISMINFQPQEN
ncbi:hypothetical protein FQ087_01325 [Sporosarcina sp. ANT_H38]|uniref:hypothetical protein n=1 Tax=Sporosarcina sp. ANT_H38 TaxID=2597358 RepID=UPI0011F11617|nr:hypothetical protein [Sporosarcina sp. ANT_H38]KAA0964991.1 hypothetical protein FQ087_01325 [Sporosarcina sp. ANT_H38]